MYLGKEQNIGSPSLIHFTASHIRFCSQSTFLHLLMAFLSRWPSLFSQSFCRKPNKLSLHCSGLLHCGWKHQCSNSFLKLHINKIRPQRKSVSCMTQCFRDSIFRLPHDNLHIAVFMFNYNGGFFKCFSLTSFKSLID